MNKFLVVLVIVIIVVLLTVACRSRGSSWETNTTTAPQVQNQPRLLIQQPNDSDQLSILPLDSDSTEDYFLERVSSLEPLLASGYFVFNNILVGPTGNYVELPNGMAAPNGLWLTAEDDAGLHLFRVDGGRMLLSANGRFPLWSSDSEQLAYADDTGLWIVDMSDLSSQQVSNTGSEPLAWSSDNQQIFLRRGEDAFIFDLSTSEERSIGGIDASQIHGHPVWTATGDTLYASYGDNGQTDAIPAKTQARLVAIELGDSRATLRDLLPNVRNQGITTFVPSLDRSVIVVRHHVCRNEFGGLFPIIPTRVCENSHLLVDTNTGNYETLPISSSNLAIAWERPLPAVTLASLPEIETSGSATTSTQSASESTSFWQPSAALGHNPATAVPLGQAQSDSPNTRLLSVVDIVDGEEALDLALGAGGASPLPGYTYIAVRQRVTLESGRSAIFLTPRTRLVDTQLVAHQEILWLDAEGQQIKELEYSAESPAEYWQVFAVAAEAMPWLLFASAGIADNRADLYFRLDDNPEWEMPETADSLPTNNEGVTDPAPVNTTAVSDAWQFTVLDSELGAENGDFIKVRIVYTGLSPADNRLFTCLSPQNFSGIGSTQISQSPTYNKLPLQSLHHQPCFLPGATYEGWLAASSQVGENILFRFSPSGSNDPFSDRSFIK